MAFLESKDEKQTMRNLSKTSTFGETYTSWNQRMSNKQTMRNLSKKTFTSEKLTLKLSLSSRREVLPLLQPTVTRHPLKPVDCSLLIVNRELLQPTVTRHPLNKWTFYSIAYRRMWMTLYKNTFVTVKRHPLKPVDCSSLIVNCELLQQTVTRHPFKQVDCSLLIVNRKLLQPTVTRHPLEQGQIIGCLLYCLGTYLWLQKNIVSANSYKTSLETRTNE